MFAIVLGAAFAAPPSLDELIKNVEARERKVRSAAVRVEIDTERGRFGIGEESRDSTSGRMAFTADGAYLYEAKWTKPIEADVRRELPDSSPFKDRSSTTTQLTYSFDLKRTIRLETPESGSLNAWVCSGRFGVGDIDVFELVYRGDASIKSASGYFKKAKWEPLLEDSKGMLVCISTAYSSPESPHFRSRYVFKVDPKRGWIVPERRQQWSDSNGPWTDSSASVWVESAEVAPGLWLPVAAENRMYESGRIMHRSKAILSDWKINVDIPHDSFKLTIPLGTSVLQVETGKRFEWTKETEEGQLPAIAPKGRRPKS